MRDHVQDHMEEQAFYVRLVNCTSRVSAGPLVRHSSQESGHFVIFEGDGELSLLLVDSMRCLDYKGSRSSC